MMTFRWWSKAMFGGCGLLLLAAPVTGCRGSDPDTGLAADGTCALGGVATLSLTITVGYAEDFPEDWWPDSGDLFHVWVYQAVDEDEPTTFSQYAYAADGRAPPYQRTDYEVGSGWTRVFADWEEQVGEGEDAYMRDCSAQLDPECLVAGEAAQRSITASCEGW